MDGEYRVSEKMLCNKGLMITLTIFVGSHAKVVAKLDSLFRAMGLSPYMGCSGSGQSYKITNQIMVAMKVVGLSMGLVFTDKVGLDVSENLSLSQGAVGLKVMEHLF